MNEIKIIVLINGEKVIGRIQDNKIFPNGGYGVEKPFLLKEIMTEKGYSLYPMPLVPTEDEVVEINKDSVMVYPCKPDKQLIDLYTQMTSKIIAPNASEIHLVK
jgi:hypothetical protein